MSSNDTIAQLITDETAFMVEDLTGISAAVLLSYEYLITLSTEVQLFWRLPITGSSIIFLINRYLPIFVIWYTGPFPYPTYLEGCIATVWSKSIIEYFQYFPWAVFRQYVTTTRTHLDILQIRTHWLHVYLNPAYGCSYIYEIPDGPSMDSCFNKLIDNTRLVLLVDYAGPVLSDMLVLMITWRATYKGRKNIEQLGRSVSLSQVIFRDGTLYFMTLLALKTLHLAFGVVSRAPQIESPSVLYTSWFTTYEEPVTAILVSRFLIDLQKCSRDTTQGSTVTTAGTLNFNRVLGSIASSLPAPGESSHAGDDDLEFETSGTSQGALEHPQGRMGMEEDIGDTDGATSVA
ncbi:hypothetical protein L227DRAFT_567621 [Lentinus tigrinus ALCF2SS1-6]|uniref:DUF6533 domain-containing protein n=1 Tax=Lentinus tigrinus ALCF2SS1-6 TaxID=1328759 RepID=A0A5C2RQQ8_9APHY|nr:hypothetical protein L227DRAFT_567621 [Lentinus tigrinus ALCF2SS1-6]